MATFTCKRCHRSADLLEEFPGRVCLDCWAQLHNDDPLPTAEDVTALWTDPKILRRKR
jgi:hypothetical protein